MKKSLVIKLAGAVALAVAVVCVSGCSIIGGVAGITRDAVQGAAETVRGNAQAVREEVSAAMNEVRYEREEAREVASEVRQETRAEARDAMREAMQEGSETAAAAGEKLNGLVEGIVQEASGWTDEDIEYYAEAAEDYGFSGAANAVEEAVAEGYGKQYQDSLKQYEPYGLELDSGTGEWFFGTKPIAGISDEKGTTMTNGYLKGVGTYIIVERDANGNITGLREVDKAEFARISGLTDTSTIEQDAASFGAKVFNENINVKGMTPEQLYDLERQLMVKYRGQAALVQCNDYAFMFDNDERLKLSSFCSSDKNPYGVRILANLAIADEIDISRFNSEEINDLLLEMLKTGSYSSAGQVEDAAKTLIAGHYGISEANLIADVAQLS